MATIRDIINKYRGRSGPEQESTMALSSGQVSVNQATQWANAQKFEAIRTEAAASATDEQLLDQQRKQANLQREQQLTELSQQSRQEKEKFALNSDRILTELERGRDKLSTMEQLDKMEAAAAQLRLQDDKYRFELMDIGRRKRLDDSVAFDNELKLSIFAEEHALFTNNLAFKRMLDLSDAEFQKELSKISIQDALDVANAQARTASEVASISAAGSTIVTAADMYNARRKQGSAETPTQSSSYEMGAGFADPTVRPVNYVEQNPRTTFGYGD